MPSKDKPPVSMRIRLKYPDVETFIDRYSANISEGGMFIQSRAPQAAGTTLRFDVMLQDGSKLLQGEGVVIWVKEYDAAHPHRVHGMGVRFTQLDGESRAMVNRIIGFKNENGEPPVRVSQTQEVRALVREAATEEEEPEASTHEPAEEQGQQAAAPPQQPAALFAALLDEARQDGVATTAGSEAEAPPLVDAPPPVTPRPALGSLELDATGVALEMAEQILAELLQQSGISEQQIEQTLQWAGQLNADDSEGELERLLASAAVPAASLDEIVSGMQRWAAPPPAVPSAIDAPAPPAAPLPVVEAAVEAATQEQPFDPTLLHAAARTAQAAKQVSGSNFDLSEGEPPDVEHLGQGFETPGPPTEPPPDEGWSKLQTQTELLDHDSSEVLRDLAQRSGEHSFEGDGDTAVQSTPSDHDLQSALSSALEAVAVHDASDRETLKLAPEPLAGERPTLELLSEQRTEAQSAWPAEPPADPLDLSGDVDADLDHEDPATRIDAGLDAPVGDLPQFAAATEPEESATEPALIARGDSADALSHEVWQEVVKEVAGDLAATPTATDADSFFEEAVPGAIEDGGALDDTTVRGGDLGELDDTDTEPLDDSQILMGDEAVVEEGEPAGSAPEDLSIGDILSGVDLTAALDGLDSDSELGAAEEFADDGLAATRRGFAGLELREPLSDGIESGDLLGAGHEKFQDDEATQVTDLPRFDDGLGAEPRRAAPVEPEPVAVLDPSALLDPLALSDPLADAENEPIDAGGEAVRRDPELENEVFEALAGLRDTLRDGDRMARREPAPALGDSDGEETTDVSKPAATPSSEELMPLQADQTQESGEAGQAGEEGRGLRPRKSGLFKRLFGKKE